MGAPTYKVRVFTRDLVPDDTPDYRFTHKQKESPAAEGRARLPL
jgi:hypothetical protein